MPSPNPLMVNLKAKKSQKDYAVTVSNLSFSYGPTLALQNISIKINQNVFLSIIGPNGGGKTTFLKLLLGLIEPDSGTIKIFSKSPKEARNLIGYVPQLSNFNRDFPATALDVVLTGLASSKPIFSKYSKEETDAAKTALNEAGMSEFAKRQISNLSGGQIQRVLIARALVRNPKILLLDEPLSNVDSKMQVSLYSLLKKLKKSMAIILVTHDLATTSSFVDEIACLNIKLFHHGDIEGGLKALHKSTSCPIELLAHGVPHRVLGERHV